MKKLLLGFLAHAATAVVTFAAVVFWLQSGHADLDVNSFAICMRGIPNDRRGVFIHHGTIDLVGDGNTSVQLTILDTEDGSPAIRLYDSDGINRTLYVNPDERRSKPRTGL
jgi:hypothetical protein